MNDHTPTQPPSERAAALDVESRRTALRGLVADLVFGPAEPSQPIAR